jgi:hypothetical protein
MSPYSFFSALKLTRFPLINFRFPLINFQGTDYILQKVR